MKMNPLIQGALEEIQFVKRYEALSQKYSAQRLAEEDRLMYIDVEEVIEILNDLGHKAKFDSKEKYFYIEEEMIGKYSCGVHLAFEFGMAEFIWVVKEGNEVILGAPWDSYSRRMIDVNYRIKKPVIETYEELEEIIKYSFEMYEDFKKVLMKSN